MKKILIYIMAISMPINVLAYSNEVMLGGKTIGITAEAQGILVVGFYKVDGSFLQSNPKIKEGDYITKVGNSEIFDISELSNLIKKNAEDGIVNLSVKRGNKEFLSKINIKEEGGVIKTGMYVKDSITGIGTLTFIDPENMIFGALGHEIIESNTNKILEVNGGKIFENSITSIDKSERGIPGSKNASFYYENEFGNIIDNTINGIYGNYTSDTNDFKNVTIAKNDEIKIGPAVIYTVTENETIETYDINITKINKDNDIKNLNIEITDKDLLNKTGGVVQGMSGSPILQNGKLIGAVTQVIILWEHNYKAL